MRAGVCLCHLFARFPRSGLVHDYIFSRFLKGRDACWLPCRALLIQFRRCLQGNGFPDSSLIFVFLDGGSYWLSAVLFHLLFPPSPLHCLRASFPIIKMQGDVLSDRLFVGDLIQSPDPFFCSLSLSGWNHHVTDIWGRVFFVRVLFK